LFEFFPPSESVKPSVIHQVSYTEITIDPYLRSLQENWYCPLATEMTTAEMQIESNKVPEGTPLLSPVLGGTSTVFINKKKITIEDLVEAIAELIAEIQATDDIKTPNNELNPALGCRFSWSLGCYPI
jgi:hypothetical protein